MFFNFSSPEAIILTGAILCLFFIIYGVFYFKKLVTAWNKPINQLQSRTYEHASGKGVAWSREQLLPPLMDNPVNSPGAQAGYYEDDEPYEIIQTEDISLLKEAEKVVEEIQEVVDHIASLPANPDEVCSKVKNIVSQYSIFKETEYYDAINSFILVTVKRDCDLELSKEDLQSLWLAEAA